MKKILVSGSSVAAGTGFSKEIIDPDTWPNQLKKKLDCDLDNVSVGGCDVSQSLFHAVSAMNKTYYDLVLIEIPPLNRLPITPNIKGILEIGGKLNYSDLTAWHQWFDKSLHISKKDIDTTLKVVFWLNTDWMHWQKLLGVITTVQLLNEKKMVIRFVNNGIDWDQSFFDNDDSIFARKLISDHLLPDEDITMGFSKLREDKKLINLKFWINPFDALIDCKIDNAPLDGHPGPKSNNITSDLIIHYLTQNQLL